MHHLNGCFSVDNLAIERGTLLLSDYAADILETDVLEEKDLRSVLYGLFGEVGGIMSTAKKHVREESAYPGFRRAAEEEFGDALWYLAALCRRMHICLGELFAKAVNSSRYANVSAACDLRHSAVAQIAIPISSVSLDTALFNLGRSTAALLDTTPEVSAIEAFACHYLDALHASNLSFADIARTNIRKTRGAFISPKLEDLIDFDKDFNVEEQLPRNFRVRVNQRASGKSYLQWRGVFIGDPLTDNISDADGYRFHDVFHFAYAAILHWSPVVRTLIRHKRKSKPEYDEAQDGGRAIVVEEGLTAWIFTRAKELNFFQDQQKISLGLLKNIREFVSGYEVENCPLKLWERAILDGYDVFRKIRDAEGGWIIGDRANRSICFEPNRDE